MVTAVSKPSAEPRNLSCGADRMVTSNDSRNGYFHRIHTTQAGALRSAHAP